MSNTDVVIRDVLEGGQKIIERRVHEGGSDIPPAPVVYLLGGHQYPLKTVKNCKTCQIKPMELRFDVEEQILGGYSKAAIARALPEALGITGENLRDHVKGGHMPIDATIRDTLVEMAHEQMGDPNSPSLVTDLGMANVAIQKVFEKLNRGDYDKTLTFQDGLNAAAFVRQVQAMQGGDADSEVVVEHFRLLWDAIQDTGGDTWAEEINDYIEADPVLRKIKSKAFPMMTSDTVPADSWEDEPPAG
jgi:hypothetical protein